MSISNAERIIWSCLTAVGIAGMVGIYMLLFNYLNIGTGGVVGLNAWSILVSFLLMENFQRQGKIYWWSAPLGWLSGLIPIYFLSRLFDGFFGVGFTTIVCSLLLLPVPFCASRVMAAFYERKPKKLFEILSFLLEVSFQRQNKIYWWVIPLVWLSVSIPVYCLAPSEFLGRNFTMKVMSVFFLLIPFCASLVIVAFYEGKAKKLAEIKRG